MRLLRISLCLITVPMLVGCGAPSGERDPLTATTVPPAADYPLATVVASPSVGLDSLPWVLHGVSPDSRTLYLSVGVGGGCPVTTTELAVEEQPDYVRITSAVAESGGPDCDASLKTRDVTVALGSPLADRALIHAPLGRTGQ